MWKNEGMKGFFKGNGTNIIRVAPFSAFEFFFYEFYKHTLYRDRPTNDFSSKLICGGLTGMTASTLTYPLDLIRTVLTIQVREDTKNLGIWGCGKKIYRADGILGLYKGWFATMVGITPYIAFKMCSFDMLKSHFLPTKNHPNFDMMNLCLGATAGTIAVTLTYPTDLLRRQLQLSGMEGHEKYDGVVDCVKKIVSKEGYKGMFKGLIPCYLKVIPATAILFMTNERLKKWLAI
eukprot:403342110